MKAALGLLERHRKRLLDLIELYGPEELGAISVNTLQALEEVNEAIALIKQKLSEVGS